MSVVVTGGAAVTGADPSAAWVGRRTRAWLGAAIAVLVVGIYLVAWLTNGWLHLPPQRYRQLPPGASAQSQGATFTLVRLRQTTGFGTDIDDSPVAPDPGSVWVVADLTVTRHEKGQYFFCRLSAVTIDRRTWLSGNRYVTHDGEACPDEDAPLEQTFPIVAYFQVPADDVGRVAGLALDSYDSGPDQVLTPPV